MNKSAVLLSALAAGFIFTAAQAQSTKSNDTGKGTDVMGSEKKSSPTPAADTSPPESKLGSNAKTKAPKTPPGPDSASAGPYGTGLKKVPKKGAKPDSDTTPK